MDGSYELKKTTNGEFRFTLKDPNGKAILTSETYKTKAAATNGIASVQKNSPLDERYDKLQAKNGNEYFNLKAANHQIIGTSTMCADAQSRNDAIAAVKTCGPTETVNDMTQTS